MSHFRSQPFICTLKKIGFIFARDTRSSFSSILFLSLSHHTRCCKRIFFAIEIKVVWYRILLLMVVSVSIQGRKLTYFPILYTFSLYIASWSYYKCKLCCENLAKYLRLVRTATELLAYSLKSPSFFYWKCWILRLIGW